MLGTTGGRFLGPSGSQSHRTLWPPTTGRTLEFQTNGEVTESLFASGGYNTPPASSPFMSVSPLELVTKNFHSGAVAFTQANSIFVQSHTDFLGGTAVAKKTETCIGRWEHGSVEPLQIHVPPLSSVANLSIKTENISSGSSRCKFNGYNHRNIHDGLSTTSTTTTTISSPSEQGHQQQHHQHQHQHVTDINSGCCRTIPINWTPTTINNSGSDTNNSSNCTLLQIKREPCQVSEVTTSNGLVPSQQQQQQHHQQQQQHQHSSGLTAVVKIESSSPKSTTEHTANLQHSAGAIPVGIAVARQRLQEHANVHQQKDVNRFGIGLTDIGGVAPALSQNMFFTGTNSMIPLTSEALTMGVSNVQNTVRTPPTLWQYPTPVSMESMLPMPIPPVGFQLVRDPATGQFLFLPTATLDKIYFSYLEPFQQAVVWPTYPQTSLQPPHLLIPPLTQQIQPPPLAPLQLLGSDYLTTASTTLHQHTQTHSTRLVALTETKRKQNVSNLSTQQISSLPSHTLIKIEDCSGSSACSTSSATTHHHHQQQQQQHHHQHHSQQQQQHHHHHHQQQQHHQQSTIFEQEKSTIQTIAMQQSNDLPNQQLYYQHHPGGLIQIAGPPTTHHTTTIMEAATSECRPQISSLHHYHHNNHHQTSPIHVAAESLACLTPPPEQTVADNLTTQSATTNTITATTTTINYQPEVQDANIQTDSPIMSEDENTNGTDDYPMMATSETFIEEMKVSSVTSPTQQQQEHQQQQQQKPEQEQEENHDNEKIDSEHREYEEQKEESREIIIMRSATTTSPVVETEIERREDNEQIEVQQQQQQQEQQQQQQQQQQNERQERDEEQETNEEIEPTVSSTNPVMNLIVSVENNCGIISSDNPVQYHIREIPIPTFQHSIVEEIQEKQHIEIIQQSTTIPLLPLPQQLPLPLPLQITHQLHHHHHHQQQLLPPQVVPVDLSGLELLSNSIEAFEKKSFIKQEPNDDENIVNNNCHIQHQQQQQQQQNSSRDFIENETEELGGLNLLCALAEQRFHEEIDQRNNTQNNNNNNIENNIVLDESREQSPIELKRRKHKHSSSGGGSGGSGNSSSKKSNKKIKQERAGGGSGKERKRKHRSEEDDDEQELKRVGNICKNVKHLENGGCHEKCNCPTSDLYIAMKTMRKRLADITRQCKEKKRELDEMSPLLKNHLHQKDEQSLMSTGINELQDDHNTSAQLMEQNKKLTSFENSNYTKLNIVPLPIVSPNFSTSSQSESNLIELPKLSSDTDSSKYDDFDTNSNSEKLSTSKRKLCIPKKHDDTSLTETIFAKKPKSLVGYILASKNRMSETNVKGMFYTNDPNDEKKYRKLKTKIPTTTIISSSSTSAAAAATLTAITPTHIKIENSLNDEFPITPIKIQQQPLRIKHEKIDNDDDKKSSTIGEFSVLTTTTTTTLRNENILQQQQQQQPQIEKKTIHKTKHHSKHKKSRSRERKHRRSSEIKDRKRRIDLMCYLTEEHLIKDRCRVITAMGGLFYAGCLSAIQPPDVYAVTLDGERGNRPHILSREEILRDAIVEVAPGTIDEIPPGTRVCAFWSQQYRCLYPGTVAEPGSPDSANGTKFVRIEFDDGDNGRIAIEDIRFLLSDYPIVVYDRNPLLSLGKRKRRSSHSITDGSLLDSSTSTVGHTIINNSILLKQSQQQQQQDSDDEQNKDDNEVAHHRERKRLKKLKKDKIKYEIKTNLETGTTINIATGITTGTTTITTTGVQNIIGNKLTTENNNNINNTNNKKHKRKHKCGDDLCKHRKHKKRRKHKKHHHRDNNDDDVSQEYKDEIEIDSVSQQDTIDDEVFNIDDDDNNDNDDDDDDDDDDNKKVIELKLSTIVKNKKNNKNKEKFNPNIKEDTMTEEDVASSITESSGSFYEPHKKKERQNSVETRSKIAPFLPARQLWDWSGKGYKRACAKGRAKKTFYKQIQRGKESISVGDSAVFLSTGRPDRPYIGRIESMWETSSSNMVVRVKWFYHPEETEGCPNLKYPGALFESPHEDENDVQTISHKCEVLPLINYTKKFGSEPKMYLSIYDNNDTYYLAGHYDPTAINLKMQIDIPTLPENTTWI